MLRVGKPKEDERALSRLLKASNDVAERFGCARLYAQPHRRMPRPKGGSKAAMPEVVGVEDEEELSKSFHISLAWSLDVDEVMGDYSLVENANLDSLMRKVCDMEIAFTEVKIRAGKDVSTVPFEQRRTSERGILG